MQSKQAVSSLDKLKQFTRVVADTADYYALPKYQPEDATTNPTLLLQASQMEQYKPLLREAITNCRHRSKSGMGGGGGIDGLVAMCTEKFTILFGRGVLENVLGRVSTEIDARLSFDTDATVNKARHLISLYEEHGISKERVLIKIAGTWEGIQACKRLEKEGIHCNMTLIFSLVQAVACAEVGATLVSPFAGRITDYYKTRDKVDHYPPQEDPGVLSVKTIFNYFKKHNYKTQVMGASFRTKEQILELVGCDFLTVSTKLLEELNSSSNREVEKKLDAELAKQQEVPQKIGKIDEKTFRWQINEDEMACEKLAEGIRKFAADQRKLEQSVKQLLQNNYTA